MNEKNGRTWRGIQTALLIGSLGFLFVDKLVMPSVNSGALAAKVEAQGLQIARIEECVLTLKPLPNVVSGLVVSMDNVKAAIDRVEKQIIRHIDEK